MKISRTINIVSGKVKFIRTVASLGLVSPGAATEGVTTIFFWKKLTTLFAHHCQITVNFVDFTRVSPPCRVSPVPFYLPDLLSPLFFVNWAHKSSCLFRCHHPGWCHPGWSAPSSCDATVSRYSQGITPSKVVKVKHPSIDSENLTNNRL